MDMEEYTTEQMMSVLEECDAGLVGLLFITCNFPVQSVFWIFFYSIFCFVFLRDLGAIVSTAVDHLMVKFMYMLADDQQEFIKVETVEENPDNTAGVDVTDVDQAGESCGVRK